MDAHLGFFGNRMDVCFLVSAASPELVPVHLHRTIGRFARGVLLAGEKQIFVHATTLSPREVRYRVEPTD
ncbi:hypothetical protein ACWDKQ_15480 [Saccharopolyspora sp. NPDC000995]